MPTLDLSMTAPELTVALVDIESVSGNESAIAGAVYDALTRVAHLQVERIGNTVVARTDGATDQRVVIAGHLDTVPVADNLPARVSDGMIHGLGSCDMKGGCAVALRLAATIEAPVRGVTYVFYECEEVEADRNGLGILARDRPELLAADFAVLMEPTNAMVEGGCQGTLRVDVTVLGRRAHAARSWLGTNAIHAAGEVLARLAAYEPRVVEIAGLTYREGLNAVGIHGGVAGNVIPDECVVSVNFRFAPDRTPEQAYAHVRDEVLSDFSCVMSDSAPGALPGLDRPAAAAFVAAIGTPPRAKYGWTDVARFAELGVPAVNYGPGDPGLAHTREEFVPIASVLECEERMLAWLR